MRSLFISVVFALVVTAGAAVKKEAASPPPNKDVKQKALSLVRVNVTGQPYDYFRPWQKKAPVSKRALGAVLSKGRVLVTADLVTNQNYVELERAESGEKTAANVEVIDYEANLALLQPSEKNFLDGIAPLDIAGDTVVGDRLAAWQLQGGLTVGLLAEVKQPKIVGGGGGEFGFFEIDAANPITFFLEPLNQMAADKAVGARDQHASSAPVLHVEQQCLHQKSVPRSSGYPAIPEVLMCLLIVEVAPHVQPVLHDGEADNGELVLD